MLIPEVPHLVCEATRDIIGSSNAFYTPVPIVQYPEGHLNSALYPSH